MADAVMDPAPPRRMVRSLEIRNGTSIHLFFSAIATRNGHSINFFLSDAITLHVIVRAAKNQLVVNDRLGEGWGRERVLGIPDGGLADGFGVTITFSARGISLRVPGAPALEIEDRFIVIGSARVEFAPSILLRDAAEAVVDTRGIALRGHIDSVTKSGFAEGWAFDNARPDFALTICIHREDGAELGRGFAWAFRKDLAEAGLRHGWCAFRLRLSQGAEALRGTRLILRDSSSGAQIHASDSWRVHNGADAACATLPQVAAQDPTVLRSLQQLSGCGALFAGFVARHGAAEFVRAAHGYLLDRAPAHTALERHEALLRMGAVTPFGLLMLLAETEEFRARPRLLPSPSSPGFVFYR